MPFMSEHPMIRPLSDYGRFVHDAFPRRRILHERCRCAVP